jgi:hypothetical protein
MRGGALVLAFFFGVCFSYVATCGQARADMGLGRVEAALERSARAQEALVQLLRTGGCK